MNICLLGATGRVGSVVLEHLLRDAHHVQALIRNTNKQVLKAPNLHAISGNVLNPEDLNQAMYGTEVVFCSLNTNGDSTLSEAMPLIIKSMKQNTIKRIISVGTAGILQARSDPRLYRFQSSESKRKTTKDAEEHLKAYLALEASDLEWTIVCPTYLPDGERIGKYRIEKNMLPENPSSISIFDTGDFVYHQLFTEEFIGYRVGITY